MPKEYELRTLADIIEAVTEENMETFLSDFSMWLGIEVGLKGIAGVTSKYRGLMRWRDDGVKGISEVNIEVKHE